MQIYLFEIFFVIGFFASREHNDRNILVIGIIYVKADYEYWLKEQSFISA